jgi:ribosomal protein L31
MTDTLVVCARLAATSSNSHPDYPGEQREVKRGFLDELAQAIEEIFSRYET